MGRTASSYWTKLSWRHMKMAENPLDLWQKKKQLSFLYFIHNPQVLLAGWTTWFDVNISAQNSIIHPQLHDCRNVWKERCEFSRSQAMRAESLAHWSLEGKKTHFNYYWRELNRLLGRSDSPQSAFKWLLPAHFSYCFFFFYQVTNVFFKCPHVWSNTNNILWAAVNVFLFCF